MRSQSTGLLLFSESAALFGDRSGIGADRHQRRDRWPVGHTDNPPFQWIFDLSFRINLGSLDGAYSHDGLLGLLHGCEIGLAEPYIVVFAVGVGMYAADQVQPIFFRILLVLVKLLLLILDVVAGSLVVHLDEGTDIEDVSPDLPPESLHVFCGHSMECAADKFPLFLLVNDDPSEGHDSHLAAPIFSFLLRPLAAGLRR